jgi:cytochrome c-type biogenesis protein CcmH
VKFVVVWDYTTGISFCSLPQNISSERTMKHRDYRKHFGWVLYLTAITIVVAGAAWAQEKSPYDSDVLREARKIYNQIMSPYCPGQTLSNCGSGSAEVLRAEIRDRLAAGESPETIMASLVEEFGEDVLAEPPKSGFASLVWLGPIVLLLAGSVVIVAYLRRNTSHATPGGVAGADRADDSALRARVEDELKDHHP